jgi:hypothetical protein
MLIDSPESAKPAVNSTAYAAPKTAKPTPKSAAHSTVKTTTATAPAAMLSDRGPRDEAIHKKQLRKTSHTIYPRFTRCRANGWGVFISRCFSSGQDRDAQFTPKGLLSVANGVRALQHCQAGGRRNENIAVRANRRRGAVRIYQAGRFFVP